MTRFRHDERGATTLEYAIAIPAIALFLIGVIEFSRAMWTTNTLAHAAEEAVRYASVRSADSGDPATAQMISDTLASRARGLDADALTVTTTWQPANRQGASVEIQVTYVFEFATPLMPGGPIELTASARRTVVN